MLELIAKAADLFSNVFSFFKQKDAEANTPAMIAAKEEERSQAERDKSNLLVAEAQAGDAKALDDLRKGSS